MPLVDFYNVVIWPSPFNSTKHRWWGQLNVIEKYFIHDGSLYSSVP